MNGLKSDEQTKAILGTIKTGHHGLTIMMMAMMTKLMICTVGFFVNTYFD
jgi:hypothetical protein